MRLDGIAMNARNQASNVIPISRAIRVRPKAVRAVHRPATKKVSAVRRSEFRQNPRLFDFVILGLCILAALALGRFLPRALANSVPPPIAHAQW
jgi:hypothetical protein